MITIHQNAVGVVVSLNSGLDLSTTTDLELKIKSPTGILNTVSIDVDSISDTSSSIIPYATQEGDFKEAGLYNLQFTDITTGRYVPSDVIEVTVLPNIK